MSKEVKRGFFFSTLFVLLAIIGLSIMLFVNAGTPPASGNYKIYYYRADGNYTGWGVHLWNQDGWGPTTWSSPALFSSPGTTTGSPKISYTVGIETVAGLNFAYIEFPKPNVGEEVYFIIHNGDTKEHEGKDMKWPSPSVFKSIFYKSGEPSSKLYYESSPDVLKIINYVTSASITSGNTISVTLSTGKDAADEFVVKEDDVTVDVTVNIANGATSGTITKNSGNFDFAKVNILIYNNQAPFPLYASASYIDNASSGLTPNFDETLGCTYSGGNATFKIWVPFATAVRVNFYSTWNQSNDAPDSWHSLTKGSGGVWSGSIACSEGQLYQYELHYGSTIKRVLDPYAKSMGAFSNTNEKDYVGKAAVVDPASHNPTGWVDGTYYNLVKKEDAIIYEVHVRDFTIQLDSTQLNGKQPGTYEAFIEKLPHIKALGVTHIQLLPVLNYYYGDETKNKEKEMDYSYKDNNYNWGYDPHNYFTPEGMYSKNPTDPTSRIKELKTLIKAIHDNGMGVILDVVYNHTANKGVFQDIAPGYWYRVKNGVETNKSGCGNDVESAHKMVRKLIVDSIKYWVDEYNVDGFRFDLMGIMDNKTIEMAYAAASAINPKVLFVGEGWNPMYEGPSTDYEGNSLKGADQQWMDETDIVAVFSDSFRDYLKMGGFNEGAKGFLTDLNVPRVNLLRNIKGDPTNFTADDPGDCVQYMTAHDGFTWHDTVCFALKLNPDNAVHKQEIFKRLKNGQVALLTSQGIVFIHAGCEMGRTKEYVGNPASEGWKSSNYDVRYDDTNNKYYVRNSYDSSDAINKIDWQKLASDPDRQELLEYTKGLIKLRNSTDAFRKATKSEVDSSVTIIE